MTQSPEKNLADMDDKELLDLAREIEEDLIAGGYITKDGKVIGIPPIGEDYC